MSNNPSYRLERISAGWFKHLLNKPVYQESMRDFGKVLRDRKRVNPLTNFYTVSRLSSHHHSLQPQPQIEK